MFTIIYLLNLYFTFTVALKLFLIYLIFIKYLRVSSLITCWGECYCFNSLWKL